jgi:hypothetical protein
MIQSWWNNNKIKDVNEVQTAYIVRVDKQLRNTIEQVNKLKAIDSLFLIEMKSIDSLHKAGKQ